MTLSDDHSRRLDDLVSRLAIDAREPITALVDEITRDVMERRFGKVWDVAELNSAKTRTQVSAEKDVTEALVERLARHVLNPMAGRLSA